MKIDTNKSFTNFLLVNFDRVKVNSAKAFKQLAKINKKNEKDFKCLIKSVLSVVV